MIAPWNASWTGEDAYEIRPCRWAGGKLAVWSPHKPGEGRPLFAKPHMVRQRRSIAEMRCTVCGEKTDPTDRWCFGLGNFIENGWWATSEAPVHYQCALTAQRVCPHLKRLAAEPEPVPPGATVLSAIVGGFATERNFGLELRGRKVISHLKLAWRHEPKLFRVRASHS